MKRAPATLLIALRDEAPRIEALLANLQLTSKELDWVFVDDASTDGTGDMLRERAPTSTVVRGPGRGLGAALNAGLQEVRTDFVARSDADDEILEGRFERQLEFLQARPDLAGCATAVEVVWPDGRTTVDSPPLDPDVISTSLLSGNPLNHGSMLLRTEAVLAAGGYDERYRLAQDYDLWLRMISRGERFGALPEVLYRRAAPSSIAHGKKRQGQAWSCARAQVRHYRRTGDISFTFLARNFASVAVAPIRNELRKVTK